MTLVFSVIFAGLAAAFVVRKWWTIDFLLVLCNLPLILISGTALTSLLVSTQNFFEWSVSEIATVLLCLAILMGLFFALAPSLRSHSQIDISILRILAIGLGSTGIWRLGVISNLPPSDNDALVHAFTLRRLGEMSGHAACLLPRDAVSDFGLRFVPCGAHLTHYMDFLGLFQVTPTSLNSIYLLAAMILPLGVAAFFRELNPLNTRLPVVGAVSSLTFLLYPYGLNGALPYVVGLAFVFPVMTMFLRMTRHGWRGLSIAGMCLCGLTLVHPTAALLSLVGCVGILTTRRQLGWLVAGVIGFIALALLLVPNAIMTNLLDGLQSGNTTRSLSATSVWQRLVLGSEWTRPQPVLLVVALIGLYLLWQGKNVLLRGICFSWLLLFILHLAINSASPGLRLLAVPFYGNWYRVLGALELLTVVPLAFALDAGLRLANKRQAEFAVIAMSLTIIISMATGYRIVSQAWSRPTSISRELLDTIEDIPQSLSGRVLNDPTDGSAWAYSGSNLELLGAVDRVPDSYYGMVIDGLTRSDLRPVVCSVINNTGVELLMLSSHRAAVASQLSTAGVISDPIFMAQHLRIYPFTRAFQDACASQRKLCIDPQLAPQWFNIFVEQRFVQPPKEVFCAS